MFGRWFREGDLSFSQDNERLRETIHYRNANPGIALVRRIQVDYSQDDLLKVVFYSENKEGGTILKDASLFIFTFEERDQFISPSEIHNKFSIPYLKIQIKNIAMREKLIAFFHYINKICNKIEFTEDIINDFINISSGAINLVTNQQKVGTTFTHHFTTAYVNPIYDTNINFNIILKGPFSNSHFNHVFQLFRNGFSPNHRDINGTTLLYMLVFNYSKTKSSIIFYLIELALIYGGNLFELDNGKYVFISAAAYAKDVGAIEILNLVLLNIKPEKPLKILGFEHSLSKEVIETKFDFNNKKTYVIKLMTIKELLRQNLAPAVFELFKCMYKNYDSSTIKAEFEDSFSNDIMTIILLVLSSNKIVGFVVYNVAPTLIVDHAFLLPEENLGGTMALLILSLGFSLYPFVKEFSCWAAHFNGYNVFRQFKPILWPLYNFNNAEKRINEIIQQSEEPLEITNHGIGKQCVETLQIAGEHKLTRLEQRFFYKYIMGFGSGSAILLAPLTEEFLTNIAISAKKLNFNFLKYITELALLLPFMSPKIPFPENYSYKILTLPKSHTLFSAKSPVKTDKPPIELSNIRAKL